MIAILINVSIFLLLAATYYFVVRAVLSVPFLVFWLLASRVAKLTHRQASIIAMAGSATRVQALSYPFLSLIIVILLFHYGLWTSTWLRLWQSVPLLALVLFSAYFEAGQAQSVIQLVRAGVRVIRFGVWPITLAVVVGLVVPSRISQGVFIWAVLTGTVLVNLDVVVSLVGGVGGALQENLLLSERSQALTKLSAKLRQIASVIGDAEAREAIDQTERSSSAAIVEWREGRLSEADVLFTRAEVDAAGAQRTLQNRTDLSLRDELAARLTQATHDVDALESEMQSVGIGTGDLNDLRTGIARLTDNVGSLQANGSVDVLDPKFAERMEPFQTLFAKIVDIRTALRLRRNVGSTIDGMTKEIEDARFWLEIAGAAGLPADEAVQLATKVGEELSEFKSAYIASSSDLVKRYRQLRNDSASLNVHVRALRSQLDQNWTSANVAAGDLRLSVYAPRICSTTDSSHGAAIVQFDDAGVNEAQLTLDATLLELARETVQVHRTQGGKYGISGFTFVGKRGGRAILGVRVKDGSDPQSLALRLRVKPSLGELLRDSAAWGVPVGGVALVILWSLSMTPVPHLGVTEFVPAGTAIGGATAMTVFVVNSWRSRG
jgi:hypothetical protein